MINLGLAGGEGGGEGCQVGPGRGVEVQAGQLVPGGRDLAAGLGLGPGPASLGLRALIVSGQPAAHAVPGLDPDRIRLARAVDHDAVLPRTAGAVHHGGAGTLAAGLGAGLPTMVCSFFADQPFWGTRIERLGMGCHLRFRDLDQAALERGLQTLLEPRTARRARAFAQRLAAEPDGAELVADAAERLLDQAAVAG